MPSVIRSGWNLWPNLVATIQSARSWFDRGADQRLGEVVAVALGGIDEVDAQLAGPPHDPVDLDLRELLAPLPTELPSAQPQS